MLEEGTLGCVRSDVILNGGGGERDSLVYKLFVAFSTVWRPSLYQRTVGVVHVPAWGQIPGVRAAVRKCGIKGCTVLPPERECLCAVCGKVEMCANHATGTYEACTNFEDPTPPAIPVLEQMQVQLPQALTCLVPAKSSETPVWVEPMAGVPAFCRRDLDVGDPQCPMAHRTHPGFLAPGDTAYYRLSSGTILVVACRFSALAYPLPQLGRPPTPHPQFPSPPMGHGPPWHGGDGCHRGHRVRLGPVLQQRALLQVRQGMCMSCNTVEQDTNYQNIPKKDNERVYERGAKGV